MSYEQRRAARRADDAERRAQQKNETPTRDSFYNLSYDERRNIRRSEEQGRREGAQRAAIEEQAKKQAELDAVPEHERRPRNQWRDLIELRKRDAWRKDVAHRIKIYEREARAEDERIDAIMAEKKKRHEVESHSEYARALGHFERASQGAESEQEREGFARLHGLIEGGDFAGYWRDCQPLMEQRLQRIREQVVEQAARQAPLAEEARELAAEQRAAEELQVKEEAPVESGEPTEENQPQGENQ